MKALYVVSNAILKRKHHTLMVKTNEASLYIPIHALSSIHVFGQCNVNKPLINLIAKHNVVLYFYNFSGQYIGGFVPKHKKTAQAIVCQTLAHNCSDKRLGIAKAIAQASGLNILKNVHYYKNSLKNHNSVCQAVKTHIQRMDFAKDIQTLRAIEGRLRQEYYKQFDWILTSKEFVFDKRTYRPPENQVNALISLFNTLLYNTCSSLIHASKLHVAIGFLHSSKQRSASLNLDIAEIFKPIVVDRLVFRLINLKMIQKHHFRGTKLTQKGLAIALKAFDKRINHVLTIQGTRRSYLHFIRKDVYALQHHITRDEPLRFFQKQDH